MPRYNYMCSKECKFGDALKPDFNGLDLQELFGKPTPALYTERGFTQKEQILESRIVWEVSHSIAESPEILCPHCGAKAQRTMLGINTTFYFRGEGLVRDKAGARRDMNLHTLLNDDPYAHMRQPGEVDDMANRLRKGGQHNPNRQYFTT